MRLALAYILSKTTMINLYICLWLSLCVVCVFIYLAVHLFGAHTEEPGPSKYLICVRVCVRVCWPAKANTRRSWFLSVIRGKRMETKAVSHKPSTYFLQLLKRIECLVRPRFQLLLLLLLQSFVFIWLKLRCFAWCWLVLATRTQTPSYPCHRAYIWLSYYLTCTNRCDLWPLDFWPPCGDAKPNVQAIYFGLTLLWFRIASIFVPFPLCVIIECVCALLAAYFLAIKK